MLRAKKSKAQAFAYRYRYANELAEPDHKAELPPLLMKIEFLKSNIRSFEISIRKVDE